MELFVAVGNEHHNRGKGPELGTSEIVDGAHDASTTSGVAAHDASISPRHPLSPRGGVQVVGSAQDHTSPKKSREYGRT